MGRPGEEPLRLVVDTNTALDLLLFQEPRLRPVFDALEQRMARWFATGPMRTELLRVIVRPSLHRYSPDCERILTVFDDLTTLVPAQAVTGSPRLVCRDADDQIFIDLAFHLRPATLLTQDRDLLVLAKRARPLGVTISSAAVCAPGAAERTDFPR